MLRNRNADDDEHDGAEVEARKRLRKSQIETNDAEHFKLFGVHSQGYLALIEQEDKCKLFLKLKRAVPNKKLLVIQGVWREVMLVTLSTPVLLIEHTL